MKKLQVVALLCGMMLGGGAHSNQLANSGFETGNFSGWTVGGVNGGSGVGIDGQLIPGTYPGFGDTFVNVYSGNFAGYSAIAGSNYERVELSQVISVAPSNWYNFEYYVGVDSPNQQAYGFGNWNYWDNAVLVDGQSIALNGVGQINPGDGTGSTPSDMRRLFGSFFTGSQQTTATVLFRISGSGSGRAGFSYDNFSVTAVPEPETYAMLLAGLGLLGFTARRRKDHAA